jgi:hypothetical protein
MSEIVEVNTAEPLATPPAAPLMRVEGVTLQ